MNTFFDEFFAEVKKTQHWQTMASTVEASEWHREANVAVHTEMCLDHYRAETALHRTDREQLLTLMTLLFHDFGKPEAEETVEKKDGSGDTYHRYAGHESVSANEFISFLCEHKELTKSFFAQGFDWTDVRKIKFMIEHHLPFGLKNPTKRENLKLGVVQTLGDDEVCFYDQLWSDCNGRISDDHETKRKNVSAWCAEFQAIVPKRPKMIGGPHLTMYVLCGPTGAGKSTWSKHLMLTHPDQKIIVVSEDEYRLVYAGANAPQKQYLEMMEMTAKDRYAAAWQFCFENSASYDKFAKARLHEAIASKDTLILDRTNQTRKSRGPWISPAKVAGYKICSVEFYVSEKEVHARQKTRPDKDVPQHRAHQIYMNMDVPMVGVEVDDFMIIPPWI